MKQFKIHLLNRLPILKIVSLSVLISLLMLVFRMKLKQSNDFMFLIWNVFLASIPYLISTLVTFKEDISKTSLCLCFCIWIVFLPNAPYIITDLLHLRFVKLHYIWLDVLMICSFAVNGILFFFLSINDLEQILIKYMTKKRLKYCIVLIFFLSGFGVYLGRFLRFNSWEIINKPSKIIRSISEIILQPISHGQAWLFTFGFGLFLTISYFTLITIKKTTN